MWLALKLALTVLVLLAAFYRSRLPLVGVEGRTRMAGFGQTSRAYAVVAAMIAILVIWLEELADLARI